MTMMMPCCKKDKYILFLVATVWVVVGVRGDVKSCLPPNVVSAGIPSSLPMLPDSYQVKMEVTEEGQNVTIQTHLIVDGLGNRAVIKERGRGTETTLFFYYDTQELINVTGTVCSVNNLTTDPQRFDFHGETLVDGRGHIPDGSSALYFGSDIAKVYKGRGYMVRGIECQLWHTCFSSPYASDINVTIDYYFSVRTWSTPSLFSPVPIRYEMTINNSRSVHDFFDFMPDIDSDPTVFEIPEGVTCAGRVNTQDMPKLTSHYFHFQEEIIDIYNDRITQAEVWYDLDYKLVRVDYRSPSPEPPLQTTDPVSVIHDYTYGVSYVKDLVSGECSPMALEPSAFDGQVNEAAYLQNGSFVLNMKTPDLFFFLDSNFTYNGQRYSRDALCDVFISHRYDFDYFKNGSRMEATVEVSFLAEGWLDFSKDTGGLVTQRFPFRMEVWLPQVSQNFVFNIFDFDTERPDLSVFDVTDCYNDSASLQIKVHFLGAYHRDREHEVRVVGQTYLAATLMVSPLRLNNIQLQYDASYLYFIVTLLDRTPSLAQFTHLPKAVTEKVDDFSWGNVTGAGACSDLCVNNEDITCQSFEYCPNERGGTCRISRLHISEGSATVVPGICDLYSRTVNVNGPPEKTAKEAYSNLKDAINSQQLYFEIEDVVYFAVDSEILFGQLEEVTLPTLTGQFSYRVEMTFPRDNQVNTFDVWYDSVSKLMRVDTRDAMAGAPYYTPFTVSSIHDYNTGIAYNVDSHRGNCTVGPIPTNRTFDGQPVNWTRVMTTDIPVLGLKTPLQIFYLDNTYTFTGQKTVRGILCDVFESWRTDFTIGSRTQHSVFQYFFQSRNWVYEADTHDDLTRQQPVQLLVSDTEGNQFIIYNFYDYNDEHITYDNFNIVPCFTDDQRIDFVIDFNQTYHPFLDDHEWLFRQEVQLLLSSQLRVSALRFQNLRVTYNLDRTYVMATLLGQVSPQFHFAEAGTSSPYAARTVTPQADVSSCAASCYYGTDFICNSFDLCPDGSCYLSSRHVPDADVTDPQVTCRHLSRLTNGTEPEPTLDDAFEALKDLVYKGLLIVTLSSDDGSQQFSFPGMGVRDDLLSLTPSSDTGGADLHSKFRLYKAASSMSASVLSLPGLAVDECATSCWHADMFTCNAFTYCYSTGDCMLNVNRPANRQDLLSLAPLCDVYSRLYVDGYYQYPGRVLESVADRTVSAASQEDCARRCTLTSSFPCRSFDFCPTTGHCLLHQRHVLDYDTALNNSWLCSHFSRNYLADFSVQAQKMVNGHDDAIIDGVDATKCAYQCFKESACQSFEFCGGQCRLSSLLPPPSLVTDSNYCDLYTLTANSSAVDRWPLNPSHEATTSSPGGPGKVSSRDPGKVNTPGKGSTASSGDTTTGGAIYPNDCDSKQTSNGSSDDTGEKVGIGVGVLVLGVLLGAGLVLLIQRVLGKRRDADTIELMPRIR